MSVASFFRKYSVGCILNYVRLIITREISCIYIQLLLQLCIEVSQVTTQLSPGAASLGRQGRQSLTKYFTNQNLF
jgi:hypothetical protein